MQQLSFTIPYTSSAIRATISALSQMDNDLNGTVGLFNQAVDNARSSIPEFRDVPNTPAPVNTGTPPPPPSHEEQLAHEYAREDALAEDTDDTSDEQSAPEGSLDSAGMPWDARIHSSSKAFLKSDGTWKLKKGVDKALVAQVTSESMGNVGTSQTPSNVSTPPPPGEPTAEPASVPAPPTSVAAPVNEGKDPFRTLIADIAKIGKEPSRTQNIGRSLGMGTIALLRGHEATRGKLLYDLVASDLTEETISATCSVLGITELNDETIDLIRMSLGL